MVVEGDNVSLQCHPPNGSVTVGWHRGAAALSPGGRLWLSADNRTLTVTAAQRGDAGPYGCHVANPISANRSRDVNLTVLCESAGGGATPPSRSRDAARWSRDAGRRSRGAAWWSREPSGAPW